MPAPLPIDGELLLEQASWIRALARGLVADAHLAEDLAQDACVAALERPPRDRSNPRGWLATVLRNFQRQSARAEVRRVERETRAARSEAQPDALDVLERASLHRELYESVMALSEPNRTAILLRFFDGLPQRKIASQLGVPVATVHSRVQRGLAELRTRLARHRGGDARAWVLALLPLAKQAAPWTPGAFAPPLGAVLMDAKVKTLIALAVTACGVLGVWPLLRPDPAASHVSSSAAAPEIAKLASARPADTLPASAGSSETRTAADAPQAPRAVEKPIESAASAAVIARGRVLDPRSVALSGVRVALRSPNASVETTSDRTGAFALDVPASVTSGEIVSADPALATVLAGTWSRGASLVPVVVVAPLRPLGGTVVDENGLPIEGAHVALRLPKDFEAGFAQVLDASIERAWSATSDARGGFAIDGAPAVDGARLATSHDQYLPDQRAAPELADTALEIVLLRPAFDERALEGIVLGPSGEAVESAHVALGEREATSARDGRFSFALDERDTSEELRAVKRGFLPAELHASPGEGRRWPRFVTLHLGGPPSSIAGSVVDEDGNALAHAKVWLADPTLFGQLGDMPAHVENLLAKDAPEFWTFVESAADGRFEIEGLLPRSYRLRAMDPASLAMSESEPIAAGTENARLRIGTRELREVRGVVHTLAGAPLAGIQVTVVRHTFVVESKGSRSSNGASGATCQTDAEGRFTLQSVPRDTVFLTFSDDAIVDAWRDLEPGDTALELDVPVAARLHFQLELEAPEDRADRFAILDRGGERLSIMRIRGSHEWSSDTMELEGGRTPVLAVAEGATTLVLMKGKDEVERHPLALAPGTLNSLRF